MIASVFSRPPWNQKWTAKNAAKHIEETFCSPHFLGVIALEKDKPIAFAYGVFFQWENERRFYLKEICVGGEKQRGGVGTRLLTHLIKKLEAEKVSQISLGTEPDKPAKQFYLKLGFKIVPEIIIMAKRLPRTTSKRG